MNIIARVYPFSYKPHMDFLINEHGFHDFHLYQQESKDIQGSWKLFQDLVAYTLLIFRRIQSFRKAEIIVVSGWIAVVLKMLIKMRIISCKKFYWLGFLLHNKKVFPYIKWLLRLTAIRQETYIVNAAYDAKLYHKELGIPSYKLKVLPYGDWNELTITEPVQSQATEEYYFAGGYTDRDYASLIKAFHNIDKKLIIVGSHLNKDLKVKVPTHIEIRKDIDRKEFHQLVRDAKACILPMKQATGASGHMVLFNYMKDGKAAVVSNVPGLKEYVADGKSALLMNNIVQDLPHLIQRLENEPELGYRLGKGAIQYYKDHFGPAAMSRQFADIIFSEEEQAESDTSESEPAKKMRTTVA